MMLLAYKKSLCLNNTIKNHYKPNFLKKMTTRAEPIQQSRSSTSQSFEALNQFNEKGEQRRSRPSGSSDFENINDRKMQEGELQQNLEQRNPQLGAKLEILQKLIIKNQKSVEEQFEILKVQCRQKERQVETLRSENSHLKKKYNELEQSLGSYKEEMEKLRQKSKQQLQVTSSIKNASEISHLSYDSPSKDSFKKKPIHLNSLQEQLRQNLQQCEVKINSLSTKLQFFQSQDRKVRQFLSKFLKFNPSFTMQLSTLVESAVIQLDTYLKEVNRQVENMIIGAHMGHSNKITTKRETMEEEKYNHWEMLSNLDVVRKYVDECYRK